MPKPVYMPYMPETRITSNTRRIVRLERRPLPFVIVDHHKIFSDRKITKVLDPAFQWPVSDDVLDSGLDVIAIRAYVTTVGGACSLYLVNVSTGNTLVSTTIAAGDRISYEAEAIDECFNYLNWVDVDDRLPPELKVVTTAGGGTKGLGIYVYYGHDRRP